MGAGLGLPATAENQATVEYQVLISSCCHQLGGS